MSESDTMFNKLDQRCAAIQPMLSTNQSYDNRTSDSTLKMLIWIATNNSDVPMVMKTSEGHIMPPHIFEVGLKVNTKVYLEVLKSVVIPWCNQMAGGRPWVWQQDPGLASEGVLRLCTLLSLAPSSPGLNPLDYFVWSYVERITNTTSHNTKASLIAAIRRVFAKLHRYLWKRQAPSSGSVSRRWLRLEASTLNRWQLYYIIKFLQ